MKDDLFTRMGAIFSPEPVQQIEKICSDAGLKVKRNEKGIYEHGKNVTSEEGYVTEYEKDCFKCSHFYTEPLMSPSGTCNLRKGAFCGSGFTCDDFKKITSATNEENPDLWQRIERAETFLNNIRKFMLNDGNIENILELLDELKNK